MCLILFAHKVHPKYKLIVAANRDEFYARQTQPAQFWEDNPEILAGRDLEAGGTWMGINKSGSISMLTNYRDLSNIKAEAPSRGHLVSDFLTNNDNSESYLKKVESSGESYNGFNLICGNSDELHYYGNYQQGVHKITPGFYGLSNALLDTPWPKVERGKSKLENIVSKDFEVETLFETLYDDIKAEDKNLPDTGVGLEMERMLSPMFIKSPKYGSRCSTVLLIDNDDQITFVERTYDINNFSHTDRKFLLSL
ncbi:NRDE family protein [Fulvivirga sp. RKSG066]|uniref:NRDE family protein n=1 Tax=Fulvivirga aurantia TaxID=2529383 RepID=UPI0012BD3C13|nr:NRDE family protein [Fulvivirga aurantia]MTI20496.1 NRDE family protein [Fulvivirga aurantia]